MLCWREIGGGEKSTQSCPKTNTAKQHQFRRSVYGRLDHTQLSVRRESNPTTAGLIYMIAAHHNRKALAFVWPEGLNQRLNIAIHRGRWLHGRVQICTQATWMAFSSSDIGHTPVHHRQLYIRGKKPRLAVSGPLHPTTLKPKRSATSACTRGWVITSQCSMLEGGTIARKMWKQNIYIYIKVK